MRFDMVFARDLYSSYLLNMRENFDFGVKLYIFIHLLKQSLMEQNVP